MFCPDKNMQSVPGLLASIVGRFCSFAGPLQLVSGRFIS